MAEDCLRVKKYVFHSVKSLEMKSLHGSEEGG